MSVNHAAVAAVPLAVGGRVDKALLRAAIVSRIAYCLAPTEDSRELVAKDPDGAGTIPALIQHGRIYAHDPDDHSTGHDGVLTLESFEGERYKLDDLTIPYAVLDKDLTAPPESPSLGDRFLIYGSPTGAWSGKSGRIAIWSRWGWEFALPPVGFLVLVRDEASFYHRADSGAWTLGTGTRTLGANSVALSNAINFGRLVIVENQTTTTPPASPTLGSAFVIGPAAGDAWAGKDTKLAICEDGSTFTIYTPSNGWMIYDKAKNATYIFNGASWAPSVGAISDYWEVASTAAGDYSNGGSTGYAYSPTSSPTTANTYCQDNRSLTLTARRAGQRLIFNYTLSLTHPVGNVRLTVALFRDNETTPIDWLFVTAGALGGFWSGMLQFRCVAGDAAEHVYRIRIFYESASPALDKRYFACEGGT